MNRVTKKQARWLSEALRELEHMGEVGDAD